MTTMQIAPFTHYPVEPSSPIAADRRDRRSDLVIRLSNGRGRQGTAMRSSVPYMIQALSRLLTADYLGRVAAFNLSLTQARIILALDADGALSQIELARILDIGRASIGQTLAVLEERRLICRMRSDADRRVLTVALTAEGRTLPRPLREAARHQAAALGKLLGPADIAEAHRILGRALNLTSPDPDEAGPPPGDGKHGAFLLAQRVQVALQTHGYYDGLPDGIAGARTRQALRRFQQDRGLEVTGTITLEVTEQLNIRKP